MLNLKKYYFLMIVNQVILDEWHNWQNIKNVCDLQTFYCLDVNIM